MAHNDKRAIHIDSDKDETIERTLKMMEHPSTTVFTAGIKEHWAVLTVELIAIYYALFLAWQSHFGATSLQATRVEPLHHRTYIIISDSRSALKEHQEFIKTVWMTNSLQHSRYNKTDERNTASQHLNATGVGQLWWYLRK
ncbi:hypothetical protein PAAG_11617 [Paracoccidioides lutzii Pb01]|uniref:Uncharacterized protein n=1 Tax=Paracoccidioides lutzii (strain ATCC MYA-826 / Pb01) TaxID=502779 RepID=A0A0A2VLA2_PARBA|nr:hypothetical protein PAAG_11617 [Paracoccidioides lutzii Pb01]KGQ01634.1 hypothetical protein PAAG_11617 [Paracoccidioides lutzii Pb01]